MEESIKKSDALIEALPYIRAFAGKTIVVKYGGSVLSSTLHFRGRQPIGRRHSLAGKEMAGSVASEDGAGSFGRARRIR
mgnify:CR=1 FL=1